VTPTDAATADHRPPAARRPAPFDLLRFAVELFALFSLALWGYLAWAWPWPAIAFMLGAPGFAVVVWALFRSPRAVVPTDRVGRSLVEIAVMGAAAIAWAQLGHPVVAVVFALVAAVTGFVAARREDRA
jgi:hypothetical protein